MPDNDLDAVAKKIHEAQDAEESLLHTMPNAIHPDDEDYQGMSGGSEGDVAEDDATRSDDQRQAESPERTPTEQVQDDVTGEDRPPRPEDTDRP